MYEFCWWRRKLYLQKLSRFNIDRIFNKLIYRREKCQKIEYKLIGIVQVNGSTIYFEIARYLWSLEQDFLVCQIFELIQFLCELSLSMNETSFSLIAENYKKAHCIKITVNNAIRKNFGAKNSQVAWKKSILEIQCFCSKFPVNFYGKPLKFAENYWILNLGKKVWPLDGVFLIFNFLTT